MVPASHWHHVPAGAVAVCLCSWRHLDNEYPLMSLGDSAPVMVLTTFVIASTIFSGLNNFFNFLFSSRALFSLAFTAAILAAWALVLCCLFGSCGTIDLPSPHYPTAADVTLATFVCFLLLLNISAN